MSRTPRFVLLILLLAACKVSFAFQEPKEASNNTSLSPNEQLELEISARLVKQELKRFRDYLENDVFLHRSGNSALSKESLTFLFEVKQRIERIQKELPNLQKKGITFSSKELDIISQLQSRIRAFENPGSKQPKPDKPVLSESFNAELKSVMTASSLDERISLLDLIVADSSRNAAEKKVAKEIRMKLYAIRGKQGDWEKAIHDAKAIGKKGVPFVAPRDLVLAYSSNGKQVQSRIKKGDTLSIQQWLSNDKFKQTLFWVEKVNAGDSVKGWIEAEKMLLGNDLSLGGGYQPLSENEIDRQIEEAKKDFGNVFGKPLPVSAKTLAGMTSSQRTGPQEYQFTWSFDAEKFKITGAKIPADLYKDILGGKSDTTEIVGSWEIRRGNLFLRVGKGDKAIECKMKIFNTGVVRIESSQAQYVFSARSRAKASKE